MSFLRLFKSVLLGFVFCILSTVIISFFALKLNRFFVDIFPFVFASMGSFLCSKYFVSNIKRNRAFCGFLSSFIMSLIFTIVSILIWKGFPTWKSLLRMLLMIFSGIVASIELSAKPRMKRVKVKRN